MHLEQSLGQSICFGGLLQACQLCIDVFVHASCPAYANIAVCITVRFRAQRASCRCFWEHARAVCASSMRNHAPGVCAKGYAQEVELLNSRYDELNSC